MRGKILLAFALILFASPCLGADNALRNIRKAPQTEQNEDTLRFEPGSVIVMPDGSREVIESRLSNGDWRTGQGSVISPLGIVMEGRYQDDVVEMSSSSYNFTQNSTIVLPDGSVEILESRLANGDWRTNLGRIISKEGLVVEGPGKGKYVSLAGKDLRLAAGAKITLPDGSVEEIEAVLPNGNLRTANGYIISPEGEILEGPDKGEKVALNTSASPEKSDAGGKAKSGGATGKSGEQSANTAAAAPEEDGGKQGEAGQPDGAGEVTIADLLPSTPYSGHGKGKTLVAENSGKGSGEGSGKGAGAGKSSGKGSGKGSSVAKARPGDPLRIPEDAVNTGNLSFLEGCWQGTRPEYFTKRTIKECFCFNANGRSGKRRVYDITAGSRMCVGATKANLSRKGVLSVTSSGAACNDGERWGGAKMVCRNSGPRTPCSWVFTDANNGTQAYEIPFVRVQQCGR